MTEFMLHTLETAGESRPLLEKSAQAYGSVPNLHAVMAESPAMLGAYQAIAEIFETTNLSDTERQIILMTNNRLNGCEYCMAAHTSIMQMKKVPEDVITALRENTPIGDPKLEALRRFAEQVNLTRGWPEQADVDAFLEAGYTKRTILEVIVGTSLKVLSNYTNHIAQTPLDAAFSKNAWSAEANTVR
jgi:uncharacterized peroxidase-related enzyme